MSTLSKFQRGSTTIALLGLVLSYYPQLLQPHRDLLRAILNISWGSLFGCNLWAGGISGFILRRNLPRHLMANVEGKNFSILFSMSTIFSSCLYVCTVGLAPDSLLLRRGAQLCLFMSVLNGEILIPKQISVMNQRVALEETYNLGQSMVEDEEDKQAAAKDPQYQNVMKQYRKLSLSTMVVTYVGFAGLLPYVCT